MSAKLKPCPFCGEEAELRSNASKGRAWVTCTRCMAESGGYEDDLSMDTLRQRAAAEWNNRPEQKVRVKPLKWPESITRGQRVVSKGGILSYTIAHYGGSEPDSGVVYRWAGRREPWSSAYFSYESAIADAQADYERRILSAIEAS